MSEESAPVHLRRILFLFVDGVGIGPEEPNLNPLLGADLPTLRRLLPPAHGLLRGEFEGLPFAARAIDPKMGVPGLPQSGTGQTALLTGVNTAERMGRHFGPWVPTQLRPLLASENILRRVGEAGLRAAFANATPPAQLGRGPRGWHRPAAPPLAASAAGVELRSAPELRAGRAVASSITNERWHLHLGGDFPDVTPEAAAAVLAAITAEADLTLFAHYDTDLVGHRGGFDAAVAVLERVDTFVAALIPQLPNGTALLIASDHGNVEDVSGGHTLNPVPLIVVGPGATELVAGVDDVTQVAPAILRALSVD